MNDLEWYINAFAHLRRAPGQVWSSLTNNQAPHKPFLLLSVIDLIARGILKTSFIDTQGDLGELNDLFVRYWRRLVPITQKSSIALPFSRLHNESFWKLVPNDKVDITPAIINNINSVGQLKGVALGAKIDDDLFYHLGNAESRNALRETLLAAHFSQEAGDILREQVAINAAAFDYSEDLIRTAHLPMVSEIVEQSQYRPEVRDQGFRRAIVSSYDHRCALCGIRILTPEGHTAVDAAHIQPWSETQNDDVRNGMALCKMCHWAFDEYLMSVSDSYTVITSKQMAANPNMPGFLLTLGGRGIIPPADKALWPAQTYLQQHRSNVLV